jgi:hypothetical protein
MFVYLHLVKLHGWSICMVHSGPEHACCSAASEAPTSPCTWFLCSHSCIWQRLTKRLSHRTRCLLYWSASRDEWCVVIARCRSVAAGSDQSRFPVLQHVQPEPF